MKVKVLRDKKTKDFLHIRKFSGKHELFTSSLPRLYETTATMELMENIFPLDDCNFENFDEMEFGEYELIEFGEVGADIRNKLSSQKNLVCLLERYFDEYNIDKKLVLKEFIEKEMKDNLY